MWNKSVIRLAFTFFVLISLLAGSSCKKDNTSGVPAYVKIEDIKVITDYQKEGSASSNISDAWFYANDDPLGVFEIPNEIPVLTSGKTNLRVFGGIKQSGVSSLRKIYPFYDDFSFDGFTLCALDWYWI